MRFHHIALITACVSLSLLISACVSNGRATGAYPLGSIESPARARTERSSSAAEAWRDDNADARRFAPGETVVLGDLEGPGRITHIWFTGVGQDRHFPRSAVLRIYWDGNSEPAVEAPLGDFFAVGHGLTANVNSAVVATSSHGRAYNCYWPMPFRESARVTLTNESSEHLMGLYWYIDWERRPVPGHVPYFHAQYRQENPVQPGSDYVIADIEGNGHYVGTVLSVRMSQPGWFGEGDDRFYIDGEEEPSLRGTGTEDYFSDAWAFREVNRPYYGVTVWEGMNRGGRCTAYRWHVADPVFFDRSLKVAIEHKGNTFDENQQLVDPYTDQRPDFYSSVAFWYQQGPAKPFDSLPPAGERVPAYVTYQAEALWSGSLPEGASLNEDIQYSNGKALLFIGGEGDMIELPVDVEDDGDYLVFLRVWPRGDAGIYDIFIDDVLVVPAYDLYSAHHHLYDLKLGNVQHLTKGTHTIRAVCRGASPSASGSNLFLDAIYLEPM